VSEGAAAPRGANLSHRQIHIVLLGPMAGMLAAAQQGILLQA
jgi:hypothetical protein